MLLVKLFIKNYEDIKNEKVRSAYGTLSSIVGIISNIFLFTLKFIMGKISGSVSIISDAFNNLSDCGSCLLTLFGYKLAAKPADKDHPFGHGRMEYIISLLVATLIMVVGLDLFKTSFIKIIHPEKIEFSWVVLISMIFSIGVKLWMAFFNSKLGKKINSTVMLATSKDSAGDAIATSATVFALIMSVFTSFPVDGVMGCIVSLIILMAGFNIIKETVDELLGKPADQEVVNNIKDILRDNGYILGIHDMIIHSYGPGVIFGSVHAEVSADENIIIIHDAIDEVERKIYEKYRVVMTIHMDPIDNNNEENNKLREKIKEILTSIDDKLTFHDFRVVAGPSHTNLIFDIVLPFESNLKEDEIKRKIDIVLEKEERVYYTVITFDRDYCE